MKYDISYTGSPPEKRETRVKIEVLDVQGSIIDIKATIQYSQGTEETTTKTLDLEAGNLGYRFIIPAKLEGGDQFFDSNQGWVVLDGTEPDLQFPSYGRTVAYVTSPEYEDYWETETGVRFWSKVTFDDYVITFGIVDTNILESDQTLIYAAAIGAFLALGMVAILLWRRRKKNQKNLVGHN